MRKKVLLIVVLLILVLIIISIWLSSSCLTITKYSVKLDIEEDIRIVHLTDLHNNEFGKDNSKLIGKTAELEPDLIFMTGDMFDKDEDIVVVCSLIEKLAEIAPVYYGYGNDEMEWELGEPDELKHLLENAGAKVLDFEYVDIEVNGQMFRIGGYYGYYRVPHMRTDNPKEQQAELEFAEEFEDTDEVKLLLCHIPTAWLDWEYIDKYSVDVVFSGHYHGGQLRIPFIGGMYAPYVGLFPEYTKGVYEGASAICVLSTGLGAGSFVPRFNNLPEITVVDLMPQN